MIKKLNLEIEKFLNKNPKIKQEKKALEIEKIIPKTIKKGIKTIQIKNTTIIIKTTTPSWRQEINFLKKEIIEKINKKARNYNIKKIIIL